VGPPDLKEPPPPWLTFQGHKDDDLSNEAPEKILAPK